MTKEYADILVKEVASRRGYVFDDKHYFEYIGTWNSPREDGLLSYIYFYHEPLELAHNGSPLPTGVPCYWICNDVSVRRLQEWADFLNSCKS